MTVQDHERNSSKSPCRWRRSTRPRRGRSRSATGTPSTLHLWWARRPLAAARAVIFAQMVDDPSATPDLFPDREGAGEGAPAAVPHHRRPGEVGEHHQREGAAERRGTRSGRAGGAACAENVDHPRAKELFDRNKLPAFHDPFAGGGALPLEAQRLGLESLRQRPEPGGGADQQGDDRNPAEVRRASRR